MSSVHAGGCQCGAVRYTIKGDPIAYCCHCTECRKQSASAFGMSIPVFETAFSIQGKLSCWSRPTDSGSITDCYFCPECGSRLYHSGRNRDGMVTVKYGSLDDPVGISVVAHIWVASKLDFLDLTDQLPQWETQPGCTAEWMQLMSGTKK